MLDILGITGPIYLAILLGFAVTRYGLFSRADMRVFGKFVINLALPALLFNALSQRSFAEILNVRYLVAYALASGLVLLTAFSWQRFVVRRSMSLSSAITMGMCCPNSGFVGYPVILLTLGSSVAGVSLALNMMVENLLLIPVLMALADMDSDGKGSWQQALVQTLRGLLRNPLIIAIVAGVVASFAGLALPGPLTRTVNLFSQASGALSLFVIGGSLVGLSVGGTLPTVAQISLGKLVLHPLVMLVVLWWVVPMEDTQLRTAALLTCAMPMLGIYAILSQRHGHEGVSSAALLVTTFASFLSLSALLWGLRLLPGWLG
jgi:malonate transporter and related proteins